MFRSFIFSQVAVILLLTGCSDSKTGITINNLRCENLSEPYGIGTTLPRLSWKIRSTRKGASQKAYQILVASNHNLLNEKSADLWNSGKISSPASVLVAYNGKALASRSTGCWKIRIWDENNELSDWSDVAHFSIGLLDKSDWKARYIGFPGMEANSVSPQLKNTFNLQSKGEKTFLYVNSLGYHEVYLNGKKVGDNVLAPAVSQYNKRSLVITYDISTYIKRGRNDIVIWIGQGWYSKGLPGVPNDGPLVKAQIEQYKNDKWSTIVYTDSSWAGRNSGYSTTWKLKRFGGEVVDGSLLLPDMSLRSLDKASWNPVYIAEAIPDNEVTPQLTESNSIKETIKPKAIHSIGDSIWLVDMGKNLTGWIEIRFPSLIQGQEVKMEYCDHLDAGGNFVNQRQEDRYIASGEKGELFRNKFNYHGFRYMKISNLASEPGIENINAFLIHTNFGLASSFECSDPEINRIHDMIFYTLRCLSLGGYLVDCPQFERLGYGGDGNASTETAQIMFDLAPLYNNWLQAWADCIREDGGMPHTAPNPWSAGGGPYWCGFIITASWKTFNNYGDIRVLEKYYPVMQQWLGYVEKNSPNGLLQKWPDAEYRNWFLGDWASPDGTDQTAEASVNLVTNCFVAICYETMEKIAGVLGLNTDVNIYSIKKKEIRSRIHQELFDTSRNIYGTGSQIDLTYPLLADVVPDSLIQTVKENLYQEIENNHDGHIACGLVGIPVFTEWTVKNNEADLMYSMLKKKDYPGYLYMIENGATTTWEHWNGQRSRIHNCYNGVGSWFYQALGGIQFDENTPGYQHLLIEPQIPKGITWANTTKETPYGSVTVNWKIENNTFSMDILIPPNCTAMIAIPEGVINYQLNGTLITNKQSFVEIESGKYIFVWNLS